MARAREHGWESLTSLADEASRTPLALVCQPPPPARPSPYGDVVPLGFVLRAVNAATSPTSPLRQTLENLLRDKRQGLLWPYHTDTLITCIDSTLVLQGFNDPAGVEALEIFADGRGGYFPQLFSETPQPDSMTVTAYNRFWCQPDYGTTCLASALRTEAGLGRKTSAELLAAGYEDRSALYFANPYMVDWALAWALEGVGSAHTLRGRLAADILASVNEDGSFGLYDVPVSTALAILALTSLGLGGEVVRRARSRLADLMLADDSWQSSIPFYSAVRISGERLTDGMLARLMLGESQQQLVWIDGSVYAISLFVDGYGTIGSALASLSLMPSDPSAELDVPTVPMQQRESCHPRYRCADHIAYIANYALPPFLVDAY